MLTKQQYESLLPYKPMLEMFKRTNSNVGGYQSLYSIYDGILGTKTMRGCPDCIARMLVDCQIMIEKYENNGKSN